ncbi:MAG: diacylglycerol kinase family protein [Candidatus Kerfeldbacteria bacterium]|nr:diacylglycerol kinase family protein [Candidatus Kerfeldbacteria bacterium]
MRITLRTLKESTTYAWRGILYVFRNEQNFRIQLIIGLLVVVLGWIFRISKLEAVALIFVITAVLVMEVLNTVLERFIDIVKPRLHSYAGVIKDMMAGAVMLTAIGAIIVGLVILLPYVAPIL